MKLKCKPKPEKTYSIECDEADIVIFEYYQKFNDNSLFSNRILRK